MTGILSATKRVIEMRLPLWVAAAAHSGLKDYVTKIGRNLNTSRAVNDRDACLAIVIELERALAEYERAYNTAKSPKQDADIRLAYSRFDGYRKHGEPVGPGAYIELSEQDAFIKAVQELLR